MDRKELVKKLELVASATNPSSFVPDFGNFHFNKGTLAATDGVVSIYTSSPLPEESFSVKADSFLNLLQNISSDEVKMKIKESSLSVSTTHLEGKFNIGKPRDLKLFIPENIKSVDSCRDLFEGMYKCRFGVCKEKTSGSMCGIRIEINKVFSTDRWRIHKYDLEHFADIAGCTIPTKFADIILREKENIVEYGLVKDRFYVILKDGSIIETVTYSGGYPDLQKYFDQINKEEYVELKFKVDLKELLEKHLKSFLGGVDFYDRELKFKVKDQICSLFSESKMSGTLNEEVELETSVGEFEFIINPTLLYEVLLYSKGRFLYHLEDKVVLLDAGKLQILIQTKVENE